MCVLLENALTNDTIFRERACHIIMALMMKLLARQRSISTSKLVSMKVNRFLSANSSESSEPMIDEEKIEEKRRPRRLKANRPILQKRRDINTKLDEAASSSGLGWRLMSST